MPDIIDRACETEQVLRDVALQNQQNTITPTYTGHCLYCGEDVEEPHRWCSADCRDSYEHEMRIKQQRGLL